MAKAVNYRSLGTFEFLVDERRDFFFIEANPRLQVEHTVTEEVSGVDLVQTQLRLAGGVALAEIGIADASAARLCDPAARQHGDHDRGRLGQARRRHAHGVRAAVGPGVRVDTYGYAGYRTNPSFDSLLAKLIVHSAVARLRRRAGARPSGRWRRSASRARRRNIAFLRALLAHRTSAPTRSIRASSTSMPSELIAAAAKLQPRPLLPGGRARRRRPARQAGARVDAVDPLAVLAFGKTRGSRPTSQDGVSDAPEGTVPVPRADAGHDRQPRGRGGRCRRAPASRC